MSSPLQSQSSVDRYMFLITLKALYFLGSFQLYNRCRHTFLVWQEPPCAQTTLSSPPPSCVKISLIFKAKKAKIGHWIFPPSKQGGILNLALFLWALHSQVLWFLKHIFVCKWLLWCMYLLNPNQGYETKSLSWTTATREMFLMVHAKPYNISFHLSLLPFSSVWT